jgi:polygalacturonase
VRVEDCFFRTKDDCIAVKAHGPRDGASGAEAEACSTEDITVSRSTFWSSEWGHALTVGFAVSAPAIRNVTFRDCDIIKKERGPAMSIDNHDLGRVENVRFEDIRVEEGCDKLVALKTAFSEYSADCPHEYFRNNPKRRSPEGEEWQRILRAMKSARRGSIHGVTFKNIQILGDRVPESIIRGFNAESKVSGVLFQNVTLNGRALKTPEELCLQVQNAEAVKVE